jgi:hypothetical protein
MAHPNLIDLANRSAPMAAKKKKWIQGAVKHPGIEKERAKRNGISTHEQLERDAHSGNSTLEKRGNLGLSFEKMAHDKKSKRAKLYSHPRSRAK